MVKYRIVQKGDKYNAQYRPFRLGFWQKDMEWVERGENVMMYEIVWVSKDEACSVINSWKEPATPLVYHKPEDICGSC